MSDANESQFAFSSDSRGNYKQNEIYKFRNKRAMISRKSILICLIFASVIVIRQSSSSSIGSRIIFPDDSWYYKTTRPSGPTLNISKTEKDNGNTTDVSIDDLISNRNDFSQREINPGPTLNISKTEKDNGNTTGVSIDDLISNRNDFSQREINHGSTLNVEDNNRDVHFRNLGAASESTTTSKNQSRTHQAQNDDLFPRPRVCGPLSLVPNIYGGREAALGAFPWMANLEYRKDGDDRITSACSGSIINKRYVLTAAHCVAGKIEELFGRLVSLRVGDHNTETLMDCDSYGCIDPFQRFGIERTIVHEGYHMDQKKRIYYDIALLRTDMNIVFSTSVAPICLTDVMPTLGPLTGGMTVTVIGWGKTDTEERSSVKREVEVPYVENERCPFALSDGQLCAGGVPMEDSCAGDSGGSLARMTSDGWFIEGIVSYGRGCGSETPTVYTRVRFFLDWIHANVDP